MKHVRPHVPQSRRAPSLKGQVRTCLLFVALALLITFAFHHEPTFSEWKVGLPLEVQFGVALTFAAVLTLGAIIALQFPRLRALVRVPEALNSIDLSGGKPWIISLCAGIGEELLFRAALQPLVGLWFGALIFAAAHVKTDMLGSASNTTRAAYMLNVAFAGLALGLVFEHIGLFAAVLVHATIDIVGLLVFRTLSTHNTPKSAA